MQCIRFNVYLTCAFCFWFWFFISKKKRQNRTRASFIFRPEIKLTFFLSLSQRSVATKNQSQLRHQGHRHHRERALRLGRGGHGLRPRRARRGGRSKCRCRGPRARASRRALLHFRPALLLRVFTSVPVAFRAHDARGGHGDAPFGALFHGRCDSEDGGSRSGRRGGQSEGEFRRGVKEHEEEEK